jgi:Flp pilus assembly protein TadG
MRNERNTQSRYQGKQRERGAVIVLFSFVMTSMLMALGLAVDLGAAYIASSSMSKAVDAGALAGARFSAGSMIDIRDLAIEVASANLSGINMPVEYEATVTIPTIDTLRVKLTAHTETETFFAKIMGAHKMNIRGYSEATRFPLDMSLVLDLSYSLERNDAFDEMQTAANGFVGYFNDQVDQVGLVTYSTWAEEQAALEKNFKDSLTSMISGLSAITDTNIEEGLRLAKAQMDAAPDRENAVKVVVLFTDGRPTAFADNFYMDLSAPRPEYYDGIVATYISGSSVRGLFEGPDGDKIRYFSSSSGNPVLTSNGSGLTSYHLPAELPGGEQLNGDNIRQIGADQSEAWANTIRNAGYTIYTVGLGNPDAEYEGDAPDLDFLRRIANEGGIVDGNQPKGSLMFAPTPTELDAVFAQLADRILTRLTR